VFRVSVVDQEAASARWLGVPRELRAQKLGAMRLALLRHTAAMPKGAREEAFRRAEAVHNRVVLAKERAEWAIADAKRFLARMSSHAQKRRPGRRTPDA